MAIHRLNTPPARCEGGYQEADSITRLSGRDLDNIADTGSRKAVDEDEKTGAGRAFNALNGSSRLTTGVEATATVSRAAGGTVDAGVIGNRSGASGQIYFQHPSHQLEIELTWNAGAGVHELAWRKEGTGGSPEAFRFWIAGDEATIAAGSAFTFSTNTVHYLFYDAGTDSVGVTTIKVNAQSHDRIIIREFTTPGAGTSPGPDPGGTEIV